MVRRDIAFHDAVYAAARRQRLEQAWQAIRSQVYLFLLTRIGLSADDYLSRIPDEHRDLAAALELFAVHRRHAFEVLSRHQRT